MYVYITTYCRSYREPRPTDSAIEHNFCIAVAKVGCIRTNEFNVEFSLDDLFNNKGTAVARTRRKQYELSDFETTFQMAGIHCMTGICMVMDVPLTYR